MKDKSQTFEELVKKWDLEKLEATQQIDFCKNIDVIDSVHEVENEINEEIKTTHNKFYKMLNTPLTWVITLLIILLVYVLLPVSKVKDIVVSGNQNIDTQSILKIANIHINDELATMYTFNIKHNLENNDLIDKAFIRKDLLNQKVYIDIKEVGGLFYYENNGAKYLVENNLNYKRVGADIVSFPRFSNYLKVKDEYIQEFTNELRKVKPSVLNQISEIIYSPNKTFKNRFLLKMNDKNYIYLLSSNVAFKLNYYQELRRVITTSTPVNIYFENANYYRESYR